ncbi:class I SAM-dependent methyltransferase [Alicyclobacillus curvatus]|nr:class I SAM-dependent methyltransferase [Alicyclobacillus curvatus]
MSRDYETISEKFWSLPFKPTEESNRDLLFMDDQILHTHLETEIESRLHGVETIFDAGGGTGRFSIWLAQQGYRVTHLDISMPMLNAAQIRAQEMGVADKITFVQGRLTDLSAYTDGQFDLVLSLDAPISYTYPKHNDVIMEMMRIARRSIVICVSSRLGSYPAQFVPSVKKPFLVDETHPDSAKRWYVREWEQRGGFTPNFEKADRVLNDGLFDHPDKVYAEMMNGGTPWPITYLFRPEELTKLFHDANLTGVRLAGPGALARTLLSDMLSKLLYTPEYRQAFLDRCYQFDSEPSVCGMGVFSLVAAGSK